MSTYLPAFTKRTLLTAGLVIAAVVAIMAISGSGIFSSSGSLGTAEALAQGSCRTVNSAVSENANGENVAAIHLDNDPQNNNVPSESLTHTVDAAPDIESGEYLESISFTLEANGEMFAYDQYSQIPTDRMIAEASITVQNNQAQVSISEQELGDYSSSENFTFDAGTDFSGTSFDFQLSAEVNPTPQDSVDLTASANVTNIEFQICGNALPVAVNDGSPGDRMPIAYGAVDYELDVLDNDYDLDSGPETPLSITDDISTDGSQSVVSRIDQNSDGKYDVIYYTPSGLETSDDDDISYEITDGEDFDKATVYIEISEGNGQVTINAPSGTSYIADYYGNEKPGEVSSSGYVTHNLALSSVSEDRLFSITKNDVTAPDQQQLPDGPQWINRDSADSDNPSGSDNSVYMGLASGDSQSAEFTISTESASGGNNEPTAVDDEFDVVEGTTVTLDVLFNDTDPDYDSLTISSEGSNDATIISNGEYLSFDASGFSAGDETSFQYSIDDGSGPYQDSVAIVTVNIVSSNQAPDANNDTFSVTEGTTATLDVLANDNDPDSGPSPLSISGHGQPGYVDSINNDTELSFDASGLSAGDSIQVLYTITDGEDTDSAWATVNIIEVGNQAPDANNDTFSVTEGTTATLDVLANDDDPDSGPSPLSISGHGQPGYVDSINNDTDLSFDASGLSAGDSIAVSYTITDGEDTDSAWATVDIVAAEPAGPTAVNDSYSFAEGSGTHLLDVLDNDNGDSIEVTSENSSHASNHGGNDISFSTSGLTDGESETFTYTIEDTNGNTDSASVTVDITEPEIDHPAPSVSLSVSNVQDTRATLSWSTGNVDDSDQLSGDWPGASNLVVDGSGDGGETVYGLDPDTTYDWTITATDPAGEQPDSDSVTFTTDDAPATYSLSVDEDVEEISGNPGSTSTAPLSLSTSNFSGDVDLDATDIPQQGGSDLFSITFDDNTLSGNGDDTTINVEVLQTIYTNQTYEVTIEGDSNGSADDEDSDILYISVDGIFNRTIEEF